ncbi:hydroxyacid dehydrogenase [Phototrophicus methaneseepsis]|uniref:Hydroxyacid dehydrogenase n=1 Tax=Phototrophicus methaneseepsis TaxID=2710758 RepID=A0A7S8EA63_9CHLR|nr:2-hydroxyacid dehydrogenase [Phototrophicus methaneseepsis]QPC83215.1 hydroxyacid dehydrogenase [Phototrophicus methaneseepsis]
MPQIKAHWLRDPMDTGFERLITYLQSRVDDAVTITYGDMPQDASYHVLINGRPTPEQLEASPNLRMLIIPFAGLPAPTRELMQDYPQISVHNLHHNTPPTAEMGLALLFATASSIVPSDREFRKHDWVARNEPYPLTLLYRKTALILGYGSIGRYMAPVLRGMEMRVIGVRRREADPTHDIYTIDQLPDLLPLADVLMVALPATPETIGLIGETELALLPAGAIVVNVGRGPVIDQYALYNALKSGHLYGAGIEVWYNYPQDEASQSNTPPADVPFHELDNIVMSPHRAGAAGNPEIERMRMDAIADYLNAAARGEPVPHQVDLKAGY